MKPSFFIPSDNENETALAEFCDFDCPGLDNIFDLNDNPSNYPSDATVRGVVTLDSRATSTRGFYVVS
jgi:hypothetical protein